MATPTADPLLLGEIAARMASDGGALHDAASVRAIYRNIRRREKGLLEVGFSPGPWYKPMSRVTRRTARDDATTSTPTHFKHSTHTLIADRRSVGEASAI